MSVTLSWTNPTSSPPDLVTGQQVTQQAWEMILSNLYYLGGTDGSGSGGSAGGVVPPGGVINYGGVTSDPSGWLLTDGRAVSRTTFSTLFGITSTAYGVGDGSTTFNIPDLRTRVAMGADTFGTAAGAAGRATSVRGTASGEDTHALITGELASHSHSDPGHTHSNSLTDNNHTHTYSSYLGGGGTNTLNGGGGSVDHSNVGPTQAPNVAPMSITNASATTGLGSTGSGTAHNTRQLSLGMTAIIKT